MMSRSCVVAGPPRAQLASDPPTRNGISLSSSAATVRLRVCWMLLKAWDGDVLVDLIFEPAGLTVDDELMGRAECANAAAMDFKVMAMEDVLYTKLNALNDHYLDFSSPLQIARAVREQVDWERLRERTTGSPYAAAFFCLLDELGVLPRTPSRQPA